MPWACTAVARACQLTRVSASAAERVVLHIERLVASEAAALVGGNGGVASDAPPSPSAASPASPHGHASMPTTTIPALPQTCAAQAAAAAAGVYPYAYAGKMMMDAMDDPRHAAMQPDTPTDVADVHF